MKTALTLVNIDWCETHETVHACAENVDADPKELAHYEGAIGWKNLDDGRVIVAYNMIYNMRICVGPQMGFGYDRGWCYPKHSVGIVIAALHAWDGNNDPPDGWMKEVGTGRRRPDGDPSREYVEP